jgi:5'-deoxynucleotidase YfbR-like HD superfamily hydrolase
MTEAVNHTAPPEALSQDELEGILDFLRAAEKLKTVNRSGWTSAGDRESVAEHTWRLCLMAMLLYGRTPGIDLARLLKMCLIHDLGEAIGGDVPAPNQSDLRPKSDRERADLLQLTASLPAAQQEEILQLWDEYEGAASPEGKLAKGLDKLETILQHTQGKNPEDFDYIFNLDYGLRYTAADPLLAALRTRLDQETARRAHLPPDPLQHEDAGSMTARKSTQ